MGTPTDDWAEATRLADELRKQIGAMVDEGVDLPTDLVKRLAQAEADLGASLEALRKAKRTALNEHHSGSAEAR
ncbi:hypothetical protein [Pseudorhodoferax sp. Leaf274]|uniref:hypothetical protein n=1 Tax=Pseudorhodoferax sp. Leaf274 TaxID=1736318 RepID=UPI0012E0E90D|nr:hypothetical protein [Pseudorhodoferax sp. Leaf274]